MRRRQPAPHRRPSLALLLAGVIALAAWPATATAQSSAPAPGRLPLNACELVTAEELSAIDPAVLLTLAISSPGACNYAGSPAGQPFAGAFLSVAAKPASLADVALGDGARDVTIGGVNGRVSPRDVIAIVGPWLLRINGIIPAADPSAWLVAAAERAVPRLAALAATDALGPICSRLDAGAASAILGVPIVDVLGTLDSCTWATDPAQADQPSYVNVQAGVRIGDLDSVGYAFKEHELVDVGGRAGAWLVDDRRLVVDSGQGGLLVIDFVVAPDEVATKERAIALASALFEAGAV